MNLRKISDIGTYCFFYGVTKNDDGKMKYGHICCFNKYKQPRDYEVNIDNISYIKRVKYDIGDIEYKKNPFYKGWFGIDEKMIDIFTKTGEIDIIEIHMIDGNIFYVDGNDLKYDWLKSVSVPLKS